MDSNVTKGFSKEFFFDQLYALGWKKLPCRLARSIQRHKWLNEHHIGSSCQSIIRDLAFLECQREFYLLIVVNCKDVECNILIHILRHIFQVVLEQRTKWILILTFCWFETNHFQFVFKQSIHVEKASVKRTT